ncbi:MAG: restriction endonuclease subunit S [Methylococcus sp.]
MSWTIAPLGKVAIILSGTTPDTSNPKYWNGNNIWVTPTDLGKLKGNKITESVRMLSDEGLASRYIPLVPAGSVIMSSRAPIGHLAIAGCDLYTNQGCKSFVCSEALDPEFLYFTLKHRKTDIQSLGSGATFLEISKTSLESVEIAFPDIQKQRRIAARLKAQMAEVETARQAATAQARGIVVLRSRLLNVVFASLAETPRKVLGDHAPTTSGSTPPRDDKRYWEPAEIPWVKTGEVAFMAITQTDEAVSKLALAECSLTLLPPKTILVAMYGQGKTRGQSAILEVAATTNQACFAILPNNIWEPEFLYYWLVASYQDLRGLSDDRGGNQSNLNGALLKALEIPAPERAQQLQIIQRIKAILREMDALDSASITQLADLERLPQRLLARAFTRPD